MSDNLKKEDLRIKKTYKLLITAMFTMLGYKNFNQITVNDLCEKALISRATFYVHFLDKYDLLKYWLLEVKKAIIKDINDNIGIEISVNQFIHENKKIIVNLLKNCNNETLELVQEFMSSIVDSSMKRKLKDPTAANHIMLLNFCTGGLTKLLLWQVENNFPPEVTMINPYLYKMLDYIMEWDENQEQEEKKKI